MSIVVIGNAGQLSFELVRILGKDTICLGPEDTDITNESVLSETLSKLAPSVIINAAAYTAVDKAEEDFDLCHAINATAVENLAKYCKQSGAFLVHVSTDYVFNGHKGSPYLTDDTIEPQGVYGKTKADGEKALLELLPNSSCLIRTAWVYSSHGNNFVKTMLRLMNDKDQLGIVGDQVGTPTWAAGLANMLWALVNKVSSEPQVNNTATILNWTDAGVASWYDFAVAIQELAIEQGLLTKAIPINAIPAASYPTPAKRPAFSVLNKAQAEEQSGVKTVHWRTQLKAMLIELKAQA